VIVEEVSVTRLIDKERLMKEFAGDEEILAELRDTFVGELPKMISAIESSISAADANALEIAAHTLKGAASNFQVSLIKEAAFVLEVQGKDKNMTGVAENFAKLRALLDELLIELASLITKVA
jgi:HPt (histidine-containing phosphotransfer) domain-containing protein